MKRILLALLLALAGTAAHAYDFKFDGIYYNILSDGVSVEVTSGSSDKYSGAINIPSSVTYSGKTYSVTSIGSHAFSGCSGLTSVTIPNSVTTIGYGAFWGCSGLTSVTIPNSVASIGDYAFYGCSGMTSVTIPNSVTTIGGLAFDGCSGLTSVTIPNSVTKIGNNPFSSCSGLESIVVENGNSIYDSRGNCNAIIETATNTLISGCMNTVIPNSVTEIGNYAFYGCSGLTAITIPNSVTSIGEAAFLGCSGLTEITIPNSVTSISDWAFNGCSGLTSVVFNAENSDTMGSLGFPVFDGCKSISSLTIGEGVKTIPAFAFKHLRGLTSVTIPNSVTSIGEYAFSGCSGLTGALTIPDSVMSIGSHAFSDCSGLTSVTIGNSVTAIGSSAFSDCSGLTSVTIGNSVTSIDIYAFAGCSGLTGALTIPNSVTSIGVNAFNGAAQVTEILLGESVANIGASAFAGMVRVAKVTSHNPTPPVCAASSVFQDITKDKCKLYVPAGTKTTYAETYVWWDFTNIYELDGVDVESITLDTESLTMPIGSSTTITYTIAPDNATTTALEWSVSNPAVASIVDHNDGTATVKALSIGEATITVKATDGSNVTATCAVKVEPIWVSSLTLSAEQLEMNVGDSEVITYTILPANATNKSVAWSSSDPAVASITTNADGSVTVNALAIGEATITARTLDGSNLAASCVVKVTPTLAKTLTLSAEQLELNVGDSEVITYTILPEDAADKSVAWSSNDSAVASITTNADGSVTVNALAIGEATITARTIDGSNLAASCVVKVGSAGVGDFDAADIEIIASAEGIVVKGAPADCIIDVYTAAGVLVYHGYDSLIPIRNHGIYFVFVAGVKAKVVL